MLVTKAMCVGCKAMYLVWGSCVVMCVTLRQIIKFSNIFRSMWKSCWALVSYCSCHTELNSFFAVLLPYMNHFFPTLDTCSNKPKFRIFSVFIIHAHCQYYKRELHLFYYVLYSQFHYLTCNQREMFNSNPPLEHWEYLKSIFMARKYQLFEKLIGLSLLQAATMADIFSQSNSSWLIPTPNYPNACVGKMLRVANLSNLWDALERVLKHVNAVPNTSWCQ